MGVAIGVDSHKHSLAAAAVDELGRVLGSGVFPNDPSGHRALLRWMKARGEPRRIGVECSGTFGAGLTRYLLASGEEVNEVRDPSPIGSAGAGPPRGSPIRSTR